MDNYNVNRKVVNFKDFDVDSEKEDMKKIQRSTKPNSVDSQQHIGNLKPNFNKVTRKIDNLSPAEVQDNLDAIDELDMNESNVTIQSMFVTMEDMDDEGDQAVLNVQTSNGTFLVNLRSFDDFDDEY